jgi:GDSL-like Lipase/Acylhydrolase family
MKRFSIALISVLLCVSAAPAEEREECAVAAHLVTADYPLPGVARAIAQKELKVVVVGSASSLLAGPGGKQEAAYPARLETALSKRLPGVKVTVATFAKPRTTADSMEEDIERLVHSEKPAVVIWQTGTVDAIRRMDPEDFRSAIDQGVAAVLEADSDIILMNPQYSPRTESMIEVQPYVDAMRFTAMQHEVPLFDRFAVMRQWGELGTFDLLDPTKKTDMAERVHQCVADLLADLIVQSAKLSAAHDNHQ